MRRFLLIPHLKIHNANAMSSPYTIGFPAITAWLGAVHALQRKLDENGFAEVKLLGTAISCHDLNLQTYKGRGDYVSSIISTANPLNKDGSRPAFIEEARCHLEVSLLVEYQGLDPDNSEKFKNFINQQLQKMKFAGGDVLSVKPVKTENADEDDEVSVRKILRKLMLGFVIIERRDLIKKAMQEEGKDALEALLDHLKIMHRSTKNDQEEVSWNSSKKEAGWLVPIAVGFQGISEVGFAKNQRDSTTPHRFAESVVTLGEFVMAHRIKNLDDMLWQYHVDQDLYLCQTNLKLTK
ncbi:MAG: type I-F CRISPR-associated protein Csy2 [Proteobacteria bacterium]|nr:type I-F CRISPR-associated protein Csy2 [Pseudomonadota bacterium]